MGCADRISGSGWKDLKGDKAPYAGLSRNAAMLGSFNEGRTVRRRAEGQEDVCCYHWFEYCSGRPILEGTQARTAEARSGHGWGTGELAADLTASPSQREMLALAWTRDGLAEHASIASFARATLELLAVGAPADLVGRTQQAGLDEVHHARLCFALATRYGSASVEPGPLAPPAPRESSLARLALDTFDEGCVGETVAALPAERALGACRDERVSAALKIIADDEANHAALAWATVAWCLERGGEAVASALRTHARERGSGLQPPVGSPDLELAAHGRLDAHARRAAANDAWRDIIEPMVADLLATTPVA
jgi:hypothetical protein